MGLSDFFKKKPANQRSHVDRAPRVRVNYLHDLEFVAREPIFSSALKIENISATGIGIIVPADADFASLQRIDGEIKFEDARFPLRLKVVRFNGDHVGAVIESPSPDFQSALTRYFESEIAALKLRATRADYLKSVPEGMPHWYQGANNCELSYVSNGDEVLEFALSAFGNHIDGGKGRPLRFSEISEKARGETAGYKASDLLNQKNRPDEAMITLAKRVLNAVEGLPTDHRDAILRELSGL